MWMKEHNGQTENMLENRFPFLLCHDSFHVCSLWHSTEQHLKCMPLVSAQRNESWLVSPLITLEVYATCICTEKRILISFSIDNSIACVSHTLQFRRGLVTYIVKYTCLASIVWSLVNNFRILQVSRYMIRLVFVGKTSYWPFVYSFCTASHHCIL